MRGACLRSHLWLMSSPLGGIAARTAILMGVGASTMFTAWLRKVTKWIIVPTAALPGAYRYIGQCRHHPGLRAQHGCSRDHCRRAVYARGILSHRGGKHRHRGWHAGAPMGGSTRVRRFPRSGPRPSVRIGSLLGLAWWYMGQAGRVEAILAYCGDRGIHAGEAMRAPAQRASASIARWAS